MTVVKGKIKDFGEAPYKHDKTKQLSYFVNIKTEDGSNRTLWSVGLKDAINNADLKKGDFAALVDKGTQPVRVPDPKELGNYINTKRRVWDAEAYEPDIEHKNSITDGIERTTQKERQSNDYNNDNSQVRKSNFADLDDDDLEMELPSTVKNNYIAKVKNRYFAGEKVHFYERDSEDTTVVFEDRSKSLNTSREDTKTIKAMLDVAQAKNWSAINIKGTEPFRREAWLEASTRGIEVKGYTPTEKDLVDLEKRKSERSVNQVVGDKERSQELNSKREAQSKLYTKEEDKSVSDHAKDASSAVAIDASLAVATGGKYTTSMVAASIITDKAQSLAFDKLDEKYRLSEKLSQLESQHESDKQNNKLIEREAFVRSSEFNAGRDVDPDPSTEVNAEVEQFHDNLAVPTGTKMSHSEAMRKVEAAFDRKINPVQRNEIKELEEKLSNEQKLAVESWRRVVDERFKDDPIQRQSKHDALDAKIPGIVAGEYKLEAPTIKQEPQIEVQTRDKGSQDRVR